MAAVAALALDPLDTDDAAVRYDRPSLVGFIGDARTEEALRDGLLEAGGDTLDLRRGGIRAAITAMQKQMTPRILIIDISGEEQPLSALGELSNVVEPDVCVLLIGDSPNMDFYREVTRGLGAAEYLCKPLARDIVARHFLPFIEGSAPGIDSNRGRRAIAVTSVRGGSGATTIAVNLAWHLGVSMRRHTVLLDPDVQLGTAALLLNVQQGAGLRTALETPERIDALLAERAALPAGDRLHVLASEEKLSMPFRPAPKAADALIAADGCLIPFDCDDFSRRALYGLIEAVAEIRSDHNPGLKVEGIVVNQFQPRANLPQRMFRFPHPRAKSHAPPSANVLDPDVDQKLRLTPH
jgi:pilus assembly protein CpaE